MSRHRIKIEVPCEHPAFGVIRIKCSASFPDGQGERASRLAADAVNELIFDILGDGGVHIDVDQEGYRETA